MVFYLLCLLLTSCDHKKDNIKEIEKQYEITSFDCIDDLLEEYNISKSITNNKGFQCYLSALKQIYNPEISKLKIDYEQIDDIHHLYFEISNYENLEVALLLVTYKEDEIIEILYAGKKNNGNYYSNRGNMDPRALYDYIQKKWDSAKKEKLKIIQLEY